MLAALLCCLLNIIFDGPLFTSPAKYCQRSCDPASGIGCGNGGSINSWRGAWQATVWGRRESDKAEHTHMHTHIFNKVLVAM